MIAINSESGDLIKIVPLGIEEGEEKEIGFHPLFGFVSGDTYQQRAQKRTRAGFKRPEERYDFKFKVKTTAAASAALTIVALENCQIVPDGKDAWNVISPTSKFRIIPASEAKTPIIALNDTKRDKSLFISAGIALLIPLAIALLPKPTTQEAPQVIEQVVVKVTPEIQKPVTVASNLENIPKEIKTSQQMKRAIKQDLGFLGLLGRKDLTKAIGGAPTKLKDASPGAGAGGKEGSGGEVLVGLGEGLQRVTVGNTGVAGLGGIGTKGRGGGQGGYGNSEVGSGEGKGLSKVSLTQEIMLEGGLDRSVIQATIAKYMSQVRACYEQGLHRNPGLAGLVQMNFEIGGAGDLNFARVGKTSLGDAEVEQCISSHMMGWKFPATRGGVNQKVSWPFSLRPGQS